MIAVVRLRNILSIDRQQANVSVTWLSFHLSVFALFIVSQIFYFYYTFSYTVHWNPSSRSDRKYIICDIGDTIGQFVTQTAITYILFKLAAKKKNTT